MSKMELDTSTREVQIPFNKKQLAAVLTVPARGQPMYGVVLTHGAGGDMNHAHLRGVAQVLARAGYLCLRFTCRGLNINYRIRAYTAVLDFLREESSFALQGCIVGGRSMGARAATGAALADTSGFVRGVVCLSYPLHPPGDPDKLRTDVFSLPLPTLFISGARDPMCPAGTFRKHVESMGARAEVCWVEGGDHGMNVPGRTADVVCEEIATAVTQWCNQVCGRVDKLATGDDELSTEGDGESKVCGRRDKLATGDGERRGRKRRVTEKTAEDRRINKRGKNKDGSTT